MHIKTRISIVFFGMLLLITSCITFNTDDSFLLQTMDDPTKARALVDMGAAMWNDQVTGKDELDRIPQVRAIMQAALRFDPLNTSAQRWLSTIEEFRASQVRDSIADARNLLKKSSRREEEDYALALAVQRAIKIDPTNSDVGKLAADSAVVRDKTLKLYLGRAAAAMDKITKTKDDAAQEKLRIEAFLQSVKALAVEPGDPLANLYHNSLSGDIKSSIASRLENLPKLLDAGKFSVARSQIETISDLNDKLGNSFENELNAASYSLYYRWAAWLVDQKDWGSAETRIGNAIALKRTPEAFALLQKIQAQRSQPDKTVPFETSVQNVDKLIADGDLSTAQRAISALSANNREPAQQDQLDARKKKIRAALSDSYVRAVQLYKSESFGPAIEALKGIVAVDPAYEQAADYLEKARAKKKLLDQY